MSVEELLPCPFCGGEASLTSEYWYKGDRKGGEVHCFGCRVQIGRKQLVTDPEPAAAWNRRTPAPEGEAWTEDAELERRQADYERGFRDGLAASPVVPVGVSVDALAQEIRRVDGHHTLGAGALAEALLPFLAALRHTDTGANHD